MRIYVAGPYTHGDVALNIREAILAGDKLLEMGHIPFVPHLTHFWHFVSPKPWEEWLKIDKEWIQFCDALLRLPGMSKGADIEVQYAELLGISIYYSIEEIGSC